VWNASVAPIRTNILNSENHSGRIFDIPKIYFQPGKRHYKCTVYADVLKKGNLLSHSKSTTEFSEICHIFITVFVIRPGNSRFTSTYAFTRTRYLPAADLHFTLSLLYLRWPVPKENLLSIGTRVYSCVHGCDTPCVVP
jgi:hypothetical protein